MVSDHSNRKVNNTRGHGKGWGKVHVKGCREEPEVEKSCNYILIRNVKTNKKHNPPQES